MGPTELKVGTINTKGCSMMGIQVGLLLPRFQTSQMLFQGKAEGEVCQYANRGADTNQLLLAHF